MTAIQKARRALNEALRQLDINVSIARRDHPEGHVIDGKRLNIDALPHSQDILASHVKDRIREALAALDAETEVKVKPLKWKRRKGGYAGDEYVDTVVGQYVVGDIHGRVKALLRRMDGSDTADEEVWSGHAFEAAKAAAQADFERRIRSALVPPESRS